MVETSYSSLTFIADNKQYPNYDTGKKEDVHVINSVDHSNKIVENKYTTRKASKVSPSEFEDWVQTQGGEENFTSFVNLTTLPRRKRSILSHVSSSEINKSQDKPSATLTEDNIHQQQSNQIPILNQPYINEYNSDASTDFIDYSKPKKKSNDLLKKATWFTTLFQKQSKNEKLSKKIFSVTNLFSKKKKEQMVLFQQDRLPERYPISIERVIYHISNIRLGNARRPLRHQVVISNMLFQYNSLIQSQNQTLVFSGRLNYAPQNNYYIPSYVNN